MYMYRIPNTVHVTSRALAAETETAGVAMERAAAQLAAILDGASLKTLCHAHRPTYAMITQTLQRRPLLERAIIHARIGPPPSRVEHAVRLLLVHELFYGRGLYHSAIRELTRSPESRSALRVLRQMRASLLRSARQMPTPSVEPSRPDPPPLPRYVRVNTLKTTISKVCESLQLEGYRRRAAPRTMPHAPPTIGEFWVDPHVPTLLVLPPGTELHSHTLAQSAAVVLQDKASCFAPVALSPERGALVVDACAAPGNKTSQLAALIAPGRVIACERDAKRAVTLTRRTTQAAGDAVRVYCTDFLQIDPQAEEFRDAVRHLLYADGYLASTTCRVSRKTG